MGGKTPQTRVKDLHYRLHGVHPFGLPIRKLEKKRGRRSCMPRSAGMCVAPAETWPVLASLNRVRNLVLLPEWELRVAGEFHSCRMEERCVQVFNTWKLDLVILTRTKSWSCVLKIRLGKESSPRYIFFLPLPHLNLRREFIQKIIIMGGTLKGWLGVEVVDGISRWS